MQYVCRALELTAYIMEQKIRTFIYACSVIILMLVLGLAIFKHFTKEETDDYKDERPFMCSCPPTVYLQPLNDFSDAEARKVKRELRMFLDDIGGDGPAVEIEILPNKHTTAEMISPIKLSARWFDN